MSNNRTDALPRLLRGNPRRARAQRRPPIRSLLLGALVAFGLTACEYSEVNGIGTRTADEVAPPQLDLASFDGCSPGELNTWRASATLINNSAKAASYEVVFAFYEGDVRVDEKSDWVRDLLPGEQAAIDRGWWVDGADVITSCEVLLINRF